MKQRPFDIDLAFPPNSTITLEEYRRRAASDPAPALLCHRPVAGGPLPAEEGTDEPTPD